MINENKIKKNIFSNNFYFIIKIGNNLINFIIEYTQKNVF